MIGEFFQGLFHNSFLQLALVAAFLASIASGIVGSYVVVKRIVFISGSIAHAVLGGMGVCLWLSRVHHISWLTPQHGALATALLSACFIGWVHLKHKEREDTIIAALWSTGMAIGIIFLSLSPGYNVEVMNYLFGNILWVAQSDIWLLASLDLALIVICLIFHKKFLCVCFDEKQAALQGISVFGLYLLLLCLVGISVVLLIEVVGAILVIAMLTIPAAIASSRCQKLSSMMGVAILLGSLFSFTGIASAYVLNWPPGATIALVAALGYCGNRLILRRY